MSTAYTFASDLQYGVSGADVRALQLLLSTMPSVYPEAEVTGFYGTLTIAAVRRFQQQYGLPNVGVVGPQTRAVLNSLQAPTEPAAQTPSPLANESPVPVAETSAGPPSPFGVNANSSMQAQIDSLRQLISFSTRIDQLTGTELRNVRVTGASGLTDTDIPDAITVTGDQTFNSLTVDGWVDARDAKLMVPYSTTPSTTCTPGELVIDSDATSGQRLFLCESADTWVLQGDGNSGSGSDNQTIDVFGLESNIVSISLENDGEATKTIDFSAYLDNTDAQTLALASDALSITGGNSVDLSVYLDNTDAQTLTFASDELSISGGNAIDLSGYLDNTDAQSLSLTDSTLSISGGNSVDLSAISGTTYTAGTGLALLGTEFSLGFSTSAGLRGVLSDETGTGALVFADSPALTTGATIDGYRVGAIEGVTETSTMLTQVAQATVTGTAIIDFTTAGLRDYAAAPMVIVTPVFDAIGTNALTCTPHTITTTGMVIDCAYQSGSGLASVLSLDTTARTVTYMLVGVAP